jgi:hypothetical protein
MAEPGTVIKQNFQCLENLAWGWASKPNLFEKIVRRSGVFVTAGVGHIPPKSYSDISGRLELLGRSACT